MPYLQVELIEFVVSNSSLFMLAIISLVFILAISLLITRIATVALIHTGLSRESAKFQARSAFTGVGFTTNESEKVVNNPTRRKVLMVLMLVGNAGIVTGVASLIIGFVGVESGGSAWWRILVLATGITILWTVSQSHWVDRRLSFLIERMLKKYSEIDLNDYSGLLHLSGDFKISEIGVEEDSWLANKEIKDSKLRDEGVLLLGITRKDGTFVGAPRGYTKIRSNDRLIVYGRTQAMENLEKRKKNITGDLEHEAQVNENKKIVEKEKEV